MLTKIINQILNIEWIMFTNVQNEGGRASCQEDRKTFEIMRKSQFQAWDQAALESYLQDLERSKLQGYNLMTEKYARMMKYTAPTAYAKFEDQLPPISQEKEGLVNQIMELHKNWTQELIHQYPNVMKKGRTARTADEQGGYASVETYLEGELQTYSERTLEHYLKNLEEKNNQGLNPVKMTMENTIKNYGYESLEDAESGVSSRA